MQKIPLVVGQVHHPQRKKGSPQAAFFT